MDPPNSLKPPNKEKLSQTVVVSYSFPSKSTHPLTSSELKELDYNSLETAVTSSSKFKAYTLKLVKAQDSSLAA